MADTIKETLNRLNLNISEKTIRDNNPQWSRDMVNDYFFNRQSLEVIAVTEDEIVANVLSNTEIIAELDGGISQGRARAKAISNLLASNIELSAEINQMTSRFKRMQKEVTALRALVAEVPSGAQIRSLKNEIKALRSLISDH